MKFLFNTAILEIGAESDPFTDRGFPLSRAQYEAIPAHDIAEMLAEEFRNDPNALQTHALRIKRLVWMLIDKAKINALRLSWEGATQAEFGQVPELAFAGLAGLAAQGSLTMEMIDRSIWSKLGK